MTKPNWLARLSPQMKLPQWSSDGKKVVYIDNFVNAWVLLVDQKIQYQLYTPNVDVQEAKWAPDNRYLAVRTDDQVLVFDTDCKK
jgi:dipeptidyl aminopeptidase/acylaminoacyl peptidase